MIGLPRWMLISLAALFAMSATMATAADDESRTEKISTDDRIELIIERNIFLRNRRPPPPVRVSRPEPEEKEEVVVIREPAPPKNPATAFVLKGVAMQAEERVAFIESLEDKSKIKLKLGDPIADGVIVNVEIDYIEFNQGQENIRVVIGNRLDGTAAPTVASPASLLSARARGTSGGSESTSTRSRLRPGEEPSSGDERSSRYSRTSRYSRGSSEGDGRSRDDEGGERADDRTSDESTAFSIEGADDEGGRFELEMSDEGDVVIIGDIPSEEEAAAIRAERIRQMREQRGRN